MMRKRYVAIKLGGGMVGQYQSLAHATRDLPLLRVAHRSAVTIFDRETGRTVA